MMQKWESMCLSTQWAQYVQIKSICGTIDNCRNNVQNFQMELKSIRTELRSWAESWLQYCILSTVPQGSSKYPIHWSKHAIQAENILENPLYMLSNGTFSLKALCRIIRIPLPVHATPWMNILCSTNIDHNIVIVFLYIFRIKCWNFQRGSHIYLWSVEVNTRIFWHLRPNKFEH